MIPNKPLLTVREAAKLLNISVSTLWRRVADGSVPKPLKIGSLARWLHSDLRNVIEKAKNQRGNDAA
ncbi:helix-turn-helix transcriptional regulator [Bartonella rattimassiliensis]|uniref:Excisionase family DNA binding domain-containing protein n=1 Tax=Bartonella rattimassiliensis 15908 TaxID=1094556 RepID=J1JFH5_9HYPH|nr:helix-turn-helix domain-containing protein [Bartonella rattimassiliensis]EJF83277.1 excisionase family DNA binding domain-containing protein [Bartonella rattimassiliensis 15908]